MTRLFAPRPISLFLILFRASYGGQTGFLKTARGKSPLFPPLSQRAFFPTLFFPVLGCCGGNLFLLWGKSPHPPDSYNADHCPFWDSPMNLRHPLSRCCNPQDILGPQKQGRIFPPFFHVDPLSFFPFSPCQSSFDAPLLSSHGRRRLPTPVLETSARFWVVDRLTLFAVPPAKFTFS